MAQLPPDAFAGPAGDMDAWTHDYQDEQNAIQQEQQPAHL